MNPEKLDELNEIEPVCTPVRGGSAFDLRFFNKTSLVSISNGISDMKTLKIFFWKFVNRWFGNRLVL